MKLKHLPLVVGIGLPLLCIIILSAVIYIPQQSLKPAHDFVYVQKQNYALGTITYAYGVVDGKLVRSIQPKGYQPDAGIPLSLEMEVGDLYLYDVHTDAVRILPWSEAKTLSFQQGALSTDGYRVEYGSRNTGIFELFGGDNRARLSVSKGNLKRTLPGMVENRYSYGFTFIGWIQ